MDNRIISFEIIMFTVVLMLFFFCRGIKNSSRKDRMICFIIAMFQFIILGIYFLDRYNIPTVLKMNINVETQNWLNAIVNYLTGVLSAAIGAIVSIYIMNYQIRQNNEENTRRDRENMRIQNMPILKYKIDTEKKEKGKINNEGLIETNCSNEEKSIYSLFISIKNIGLNNVKKIIVDFDSPIVNRPYRILGKDTINPIERNSFQEININFGLKCGKEYSMQLKVYYEDVLNNWYCQLVEIKYNATTIHCKISPIGIVSYKVKEEELIDKKEIQNI